MNETANRSWIADVALTRAGWATHVGLEVSTQGHFTSVVTRPSSGATEGSDPGVRIKGIVIPAVSNLHSHAFQRGLVGRAEHSGVKAPGTPANDDFWSWRHAMYNFLGQLDPDAFGDVARMVYAEMLRAGYGSVTEFHYVHHDPKGHPYDDPFELSRRLIGAAQDAGIRLTLVPVVYESAGFGGKPLANAQRRFALSADGAVRTIEALRGAQSRGAHRGPATAFGVGLHSLRAASPEAVSQVAVWAKSQPVMPVHIHIAEQPAEVGACMAWSGARPVEWLFDHVDVNPRWCLVHATHMVDEERIQLAKSGAVAVLCPTTEANLGDGIFPLAEYEAEGGAWGIGSDSQISVCPADELRTLEYGQRLTRGTRIVAGRASSEGHSNGRALAEAGYSVAARATGCSVGQLETGACADFVVLDPEHPRLLGLDGDAVLDAWIFGSGFEAVTDVMVGGRWVVREGVPANWEEAIAGYRRLVARLRSS